MSTQEVRFQMSRADKASVWSVTLALLGVCLILFGWLRDVGILGEYSVTAMWLSLAVVIPVLFLHELCHAAGFKYYTGHARIGAGWSKWLGPVGYATSDGQQLTRTHYQIVGILPQAMSIIFLSSLLWPVSGLVKDVMLSCLMFNLAGGGADIYGVLLLRRWPRSARFIDDKDGFRVIQDA